LAKVIDAPIGDVVRVIDDFRAPGRTFLTPATGALNGDTVIDISHESLIRGWQRMRQWVEDEAQSARDYRRLAETALLYGQGKAGLLPERDLNNALAWCERERPNAAWAELYHPGFEQAMAFLEQSRLARDTDRSQKQAIRRRLQFVGGAITVVMAIVAALALWQRHQATNERERAQKGYTLATQLANNLTFNAMQDFGLHGFPAEARAIANQTIRDYNELIKLDPTAGAYNGRGWAYVTKQDYDRAIADFDKAIELDPKYTPAYNNRGNVYRDKGDYDKAIANLNQAIALNPKYRLSFNNRCLAYIGKKDYDHAIADCTQAIALYPKYLTAYNNRGFAYYGKGDYDKAIADLNQAIVLDPKYARPYYNRALAYERKSDYRHAIADYSKFITLAPENPAALSELCWDRVIIGWLQAALQDCNQSLALRPNNAATLNSRGFAYLRLGQFDNAIADYNAALKINPKQANALYGRGVAETKMGNAVAGNTDIAAAKAMQADVADRMASLGITF
jgi:tetratricopeptide (TPR) repeat protein